MKKLESHSPDQACLNHLRRGRRYEATTHHGATARGVYLGVETAHGDRAILLAGPNATRAIPIVSIMAVDALRVAA
jgi:hypothetical protein